MSQAQTSQIGIMRPELRRRRPPAITWRKALPMALALGLSLAISSSRLAGAILVQPHNYLLDDSTLTSQHEASGSLSPFLNDAQAGGEQQADRDIATIIGDSWARLRLARMLDQQQQNGQPTGQLSQEMAELLESEQQAKREAAAASGGEPSLSSSVASMLLNVAQAAAANAAEEQAASESAASSSASQQGEQAPHRAQGNIMELDTSQAQGAAAAAAPSKSDLKTSGPIQWYNPKETIPVLKISSMATPSKYKKVYFRSEKKLVDGAFHSPSASETGEKKSSLAKALGQSASAASVQRRSSRGSASSAPPSVLQDGVIDFLKKFRDVYVQTRPVGASNVAASPVSGPMQFASSVMSAAASSPLASFLAPSSSSGGSSRPNLMGALSTASQMVNSAAMLSQAASAPASSSSSGASSPSGAGAAVAAAAAGAAGAAATNGNKTPLNAQNYVSFWSKTFPTWVRKMLKQMRRRSLYNSSKRQQHHHNQHHHHHAAAGVSQKNGAVAASLADSSSGSSSSSGGGSSNSS